MIVWFNNKISDKPLSNHTRFNLRHDPRIDVAKYAYASYAPLDPIVSKFIFTLEMSDGFIGREAEVEEFLKSVFPADKLIIRWGQLTTLPQWRSLQKEFEAIGDDIIYPAASEDHVFLDSNIDLIKQGIDMIRNDPDPNAVLMTSHYPTHIRAGMRLGAQLSDCKNFSVFYMNNNDSYNIVKKSFFDMLLDQVPNDQVTIFRSESWNAFMSLPRLKIYLATKEQFRHFDGYTFHHMEPIFAPPLEIPTGFFNGMTVRYGFSDIDPTCVNINPLALNEKVIDAKHGVDFRFTLEDMPAFWRPFIKQVYVADNIDNNLMARARDHRMLLIASAHFDFTYLGYFGNDGMPPASWINNHTLIEKFNE